MYSLLLLTALTPGSDVTPAPAMGAVPVSSGCCGMVVVGCSGCLGCTGWTTSCYGCKGSCHGGLFHGGLLHAFKHKHKAYYGCAGYSCSGLGCAGSCYGCWGSCYGCVGSSCFGCVGSCHGCSGCLGCVGWSTPMSSGMGVPGMASTNPYYEHGGYWGTPNRGGSYASGVWQGTPFPGHFGSYEGIGGGGSAWGPAVAMPSYSLYGQADPPAIYGSPDAIYHRVVKMPSDGTQEKKPEDKKPEDKKPEDTKKSDEPAKKEKMATLKFVVPAEARLYVDGRLTTVGGSERVFTTPPLPVGQKFYYDVRAELLVEGTPVIEEKRIILEAGADIREVFTKLTVAAEAQARIVAGK